MLCRKTGCHCYKGHGSWAGETSAVHHRELRAKCLPSSEGGSYCRGNLDWMERVAWRKGDVAVLWLVPWCHCHMNQPLSLPCHSSKHLLRPCPSSGSLRMLFAVFMPLPRAQGLWSECLTLATP